MNDPNLSSFIWSVADLLRGDYKQSEYGKVILPFTVLRRLDCVLEKTKAAVLAELAAREKAGLNPEPFLLRKSGQLFYNTSPLDMKKLMGDQDHIGENLFAYIQAFSPAVRDIFESFEFHTQIDRLAKSGLLYLVAEKFANIDLHPEVVSNAQMGAVFEELIRKFAELSNETAGEHFTPRDAIRLMVNLIFIEDDDALPSRASCGPSTIPTAGTGGMLSVAGEHLAEHEPRRPPGDVRPGAEPRVVRHLQGRHAHQGAGHRQHHLRQHAVGRRPARQAVRLHALQSAVRRGVEEDREGDPQGGRATGLQRPVRSRPATRQRRLVAVPAAPDFQDAPGRGRRQPVRHRPQRLAALHRRRGLGRERDPPLRAGERSGRGHHRPAHRHVLQHGHQHLRLDRQQPQARASQRARCN